MLVMGLGQDYASFLVVAIVFLGREETFGVTYTSAMG